MKKFLILGAAALAFSTPATAVDFFTIGTGGVTGSYFPMGVIICQKVNAQIEQTGLYCSAESTGGSATNIENIKTRRVVFGFAQSDVVYQAYHGLKKFEGKPYRELRSVMAIYPEVLSLVVNKNAGINQLQDIRGKRINVGNPGSGNEITALALFEEAGLTKGELALAGTLKAPECPEALKEQQIDGYFYMVGHPSANINIASQLTGIDLVPIAGEVIDKMIRHYPYYIKATIPGDTYSGVNRDVPSVGVKAVLVTSEEVSDEVVQLILKVVLDNFSELKAHHPLLAQDAVTKENLLVGLNAPLHPGAEKYYREVGLLKK